MLNQLSLEKYQLQSFFIDKDSLMNDTSQPLLLCLTSNSDAVVSQTDPSRPPVIGIYPIFIIFDASSKYDCYNTKVSGGSTCHLVVVSINPRYGVVKTVVQGILSFPTDENGAELKKVTLIVVVPHGDPHSYFSAPLYSQ